MTDWTNLPQFDGIDLSESYVLGWQVTPSGLTFELDVALAPNHPRYHQPLPNERTCWTLGFLQFPGASEIQGLLPKSEVRGATDATGSRDYGNIDWLSWSDGHGHVVGEFGDVKLLCAQPFVTLQNGPEHG